MRLQARGKIHAVFDAEQKTERFRLREFVLELADNARYPQYVMFQLTGDRCESLDGHAVGDEVEVEFSLRGREWKSPRGELRYFNSLDVWTLARAGETSAAEDPFANEEPPMPPDDEVPF